METPTFIAVYYVIKKIFLQVLFFEASRGTVVRARDRKRDRLWVRFPHEEMKYFILYHHETWQSCLAKKIL